MTNYLQCLADLIIKVVLQKCWWYGNPALIKNRRGVPQFTSRVHSNGVTLKPRSFSCASAGKLGIGNASIEREKARLNLKRTRILKQHCEGYISDEEFQAEIITIELTLHDLESPEMNGLRLEDVLQVMEQLPGMAAMCATPEERREMVTLILELGGLLYELERQVVAAIKHRPVLLLLLMIE